jgi:hypothetical protein
LELIVLENLIKEMREKGAKDETDIDFILYYNGITNMNYSEWNIYIPETKPEFIEIIFK